MQQGQGTIQQRRARVTSGLQAHHIQKALVSTQGGHQRRAALREGTQASATDAAAAGAEGLPASALPPPAAAWCSSPPFSVCPNRCKRTFLVGLVKNNSGCSTQQFALNSNLHISASQQFLH